MSLGSDVQSLRDGTLAGLRAAHNHFAFSQRLWKDLLANTNRKRRTLPVLHDVVTGTRVSGLSVVAEVSASLDTYLPIAVVQQFVSVTEAFLADVVRLWIAAYPFHLKGQVDVQLIVNAPDKAAIVQSLVDQYVGSLAYKSPRDWFRQLNTVVALGTPPEPTIDAFAELKATRDVFVHNRGMANETYLRKAGVLARAIDGQPLDLPDPYVHDAWRLCQTIITDVGTAAAARA